MKTYFLLTILVSLGSSLAGAPKDAPAKASGIVQSGLIARDVDCATSYAAASNLAGPMRGKQIEMLTSSGCAQEIEYVYQAVVLDRVKVQSGSKSYPVVKVQLTVDPEATEIITHKAYSGGDKKQLTGYVLPTDLLSAGETSAFRKRLADAKKRASASQD